MFTKGNKIAVGNKGGGRKTIKEEFAEAVEAIKDEALKELAKSKVNKQLQNIPDGFLEGFNATKEMALPIVLKHIIEKKDLTSGGKPIPLLQGIIKEVKPDDSNHIPQQAIKTNKAD